MPDETPDGVVALHLKRYAFAAPRCAGANVLDAACGVGYGAAHLVDTAAFVLGVDLSEDAVAYARARYVHPNLRFEVMDVEQLDLADASFDVVCSFETIEHVGDADRALAELGRVLRPNGTLVVSTPRVDETTTSPENPWHRQEWAPQDFEALLRGHFDEVELYGQARVQTAAYRLARRLDALGLRRRIRPLRRASRILGTAATEDLTLHDVTIERCALDRATEIVAVCSGPRR